MYAGVLAGGAAVGSNLPLLKTTTLGKSLMRGILALIGAIWMMISR